MLKTERFFNTCGICRRLLHLGLPSIFTARVVNISTFFENPVEVSDFIRKREASSANRLELGRGSFKDLADDAVAAAKFLQPRAHIVDEAFRVVIASTQSSSSSLQVVAMEFDSVREGRSDHLVRRG